MLLEGGFGKEELRLVMNARLYNEAFTGHAKAIPRCSFCLQEDHLPQYHRGLRGLDSSLTPPQYSNHQWSGRGGHSAECCRCFNDGKCKKTPSTRWYAHQRMDCGGPHPHLYCTCGGHQGAMFIFPTTSSCWCPLSLPSVSMTSLHCSKIAAG